MKLHLIVDLDNTICDTNAWEISNPTSFRDEDFSELSLFGNIKSTLNRFSGKKILLTSTSDSNKQNKKIYALGLINLFDEIHVVSHTNHSGKYDVIKNYIHNNNILNRKSVYIIGDNLENELLAGHLLGCSTVQVILPSAQNHEKTSTFKPDLIIRSLE